MWPDYWVYWLILILSQSYYTTNIAIDINSFLLPGYLNFNLLSALHVKHFETDETISHGIDESII